MNVDTVVVGGGVVGLAIAAELASRVGSVLLLERHSRFGAEISSRSSEVLHAGLYHPPGTLKARLCVEGRRAVETLVARYPIPYRRCGKLIVATRDEELASLERLREQGEANGVTGLRMLDRSDVRAREPHVAARAALLSSETAIVDSHALVDTLRALAHERGAALVTGAEVTGLEAVRGGWSVRARRGGAVEVVSGRTAVISAGLEALNVLRLTGLDPMSHGLALHLCKGEYFAVRGPRAGLVRGLVYPSPLADLVGLGIHTVVDLSGGLKLGPDATYVPDVEYGVDPEHAERFLESVRPFLPFLRSGDLAPAMAGIRPKLSGPGEPARDFHIAHEADRGAPGLFLLAGIESPGLTASPAIGRFTADLVAAWLRDGASG